MEPLKNKVALVTGAGRGLGAGIARALGKGGATVWATDIAADELERTADELRADGSRGHVQVMDAADATAWSETTQRIHDEAGRLDIVVHAAMIMPLIPFEETADEFWWRQFQINFGGFYHGVRAAWPLMKAQGGGHIVGIASGSSVRGYAHEVAYCSGKHALEGFVKALAFEAAPYKIALNTVGPGKPIKPTDLTRTAFEQLPPAERSRWVDPAILGEAFVWLAAQPPARFSGLRFDAGVIADTIAAEGFDFAFAPEKVTLYVDDFNTRVEWQRQHPG